MGNFLSLRLASYKKRMEEELLIHQQMGKFPALKSRRDSSSWFESQTKKKTWRAPPSEWNFSVLKTTLGCEQKLLLRCIVQTFHSCKLDESLSGRMGKASLKPLFIFKWPAARWLFCFSTISPTSISGSWHVEKNPLDCSFFQNQKLVNLLSDISIIFAVHHRLTTSNYSSIYNVGLNSNHIWSSNNWKLFAL